MEVRRGNDGDVPAILSLMKRSLGHGTIPRTPEYWSWKHSDNPFGRSPFLVAVIGGDIVGVRVFMCWTFHVRGRQVRAVRAVDTATHPDFQGRGIFTKLTLGLVDEMSSLGVALVYNTPNEKSRPGYLKMGWQSVGRISLWVRPRSRGLLHAIATKNVRSDGELSPVSTDIGVDARVLRGMDFSRLRAIQETERRYHTRMDAGYLEWRYLQCIGVRYCLASVDPERALVAFRARRRGSFRELTVCDVLAERTLGGARAARATILRIALETMPDYVVCAGHALPFASGILASGGFVPAPASGPTLTVRPLRLDGLPDPRYGRNWALSIGDLELF